MPDVGRLSPGCGSCPINLADQQTLARWLYVTLPLDPFYWIIFGAVGLWVLVISLAALNSPSIPRLFSIAGIGLAASSWLIVIGNAASQNGRDCGRSSPCWGGPVWYGWTDILLRAQRR